MKKKLGMLMSAALASTLVLSACSTSTEEATVDTGILERLNAATGFNWEVDSAAESQLEQKENLTEEGLSEPDVYDSEGYIQKLYPTYLGCRVEVFVFENDEFAKKAKAQFFTGIFTGEYLGQGFALVIDDPLTNFGIVVVDYVGPCGLNRGSTLDTSFILSVFD